MSEFKHRLAARLPQWKRVLPYGTCEENGAFMAGAKAALELAAEEIKQSFDPYAPQAREWLRARAKEVGGG